MYVTNNASIQFCQSLKFSFRIVYQNTNSLFYRMILNFIIMVTCIVNANAIFCVNIKEINFYQKMKTGF